MEELIKSCIALSTAINEVEAAKRLLSDAEAQLSIARSAYNQLQKSEELKDIQTPVVMPYQGEFYCIYRNDRYLLADKAKFIS